MAVTFTPNIGLAKPTDSELALNWARGTQLQEDNNVILEAKMNKDIVTYTPTLIGFAGNPNVGSTGSILGEYTDLEGFIQGNFIITFSGAGIAVGTGQYGISLPAVADNVFHTVNGALNTVPGGASVIGEGFIYDASAAATSGSVALDLCTVAGVSYVRLLTENFTAPVKTAREFFANMPFAVAQDDRLIGNFAYKKL